ncbi:Hypothetical predicted protein [Marmota monax]|uniref:Uncharacterized protein n=1 Tax=Marmota monax TaxID=9995 RepID=A0A5E4AK63_MARMO|nr:hypothetical protein GHT09_012556 [Marmota monax]VTJ57141.1 Hypothetical predicted protein [Marmota monax]
MWLLSRTKNKKITEKTAEANHSREGLLSRHSLSPTSQAHTTEITGWDSCHSSHQSQHRLQASHLPQWLPACHWLSPEVGLGQECRFPTGESKWPPASWKQDKVRESNNSPKFPSHLCSTSKGSRRVPHRAPSSRKPRAKKPAFLARRCHSVATLAPALLDSLASHRTSASPLSDAHLCGGLCSSNVMMVFGLCG